MVDGVAARKVDLPLLPQVASQVVMLPGNSNAGAAQPSGVIHRDPARAGHVWWIANSPTHSPAHVDCVQRFRQGPRIAMLRR